MRATITSIQSNALCVEIPGGLERAEDFSTGEIAQSVGISKAEVEDAIELRPLLDIMAIEIRGEKQPSNMESVVVSGVRYYRCTE